jgi:hypothetical protein
VSESTSVLHRHPKTRNYTQIENDLIRDSRLSHRATGLIIYLLSLPDGARIDSNTIARRKQERRDAVRTAYRELEAAGYVKRERAQGTDGRWRTVIHVFESPETDFQASGNQASVYRASVSQALSEERQDLVEKPSSTSDDEVWIELARLRFDARPAGAPPVVNRKGWTRRVIDSDRADLGPQLDQARTGHPDAPPSQLARFLFDGTKPPKPPRVFTCSDCGQGPFVGLDAYQDHSERCPVLLGEEAGR